MRKIRGGFADMARIVEDKPYVVGERLGLGDIGFGCVLGSVDIYLAAITAAARLMFALKLSAVLS
jgi:glutathione S-transferase